MASLYPCLSRADAPPEMLLEQLFDVSPTGNLRLRSDLDVSRDLNAQPRPDVLFPVLARLGARASYQERYAAVITLGGTGTLGDAADAPRLDVDEAFAELTAPWDSGTAQLRAGRQALTLHGGRLVGEDAFLDRPRRLDAIRLVVEAGGLELDSFAAVLDSTWLAGEVPGPRPPGDYLGAIGLALHLGQRTRLRTHLLARLAQPLADQDDPASEPDERAPVRIATAGFDVDLSPFDVVTGHLGGSVQLGEWRALAHQAFDLSVAITLAAPLRGRPSLQVGYDLSSGDNHDLDNKSTGFDNPLGDVHARFGAADLLLPKNAADLYAAVGVQDGASTLKLSLHRLSLATAASPWVDGAGATRASPGAVPGGLLGTEADLEGSLLLNDHVAIELLYAAFWPSAEVARQVGPAAAHRVIGGVRLEF